MPRVKIGAACTTVWSEISEKPSANAGLWLAWTSGGPGAATQSGTAIARWARTFWRLQVCAASTHGVVSKHSRCLHACHLQA